MTAGNQAGTSATQSHSVRKQHWRNMSELAEVVTVLFGGVQ